VRSNGNRQSCNASISRVDSFSVSVGRRAACLGQPCSAARARHNYNRQCVDIAIMSSMYAAVGARQSGEYMIDDLMDLMHCRCLHFRRIENGKFTWLKICEGSVFRQTCLLWNTATWVDHVGVSLHVTSYSFRFWTLLSACANVSKLQLPAKTSSLLCDNE